MKYISLLLLFLCFGCNDNGTSYDKMCYDKEIKLRGSDVGPYGDYSDKYDEWKDSTGCRSINCDGVMKITIHECVENVELK